MAGITFNLILIRVNQDRLRLTDSYADTGSVLQFHHSMTHHTGTTTPETQAADQVDDKEHCAEKEKDGRD